jgi:integrase
MDEEGACGPWPAVMPSEALLSAYLFSPREAMADFRAAQRKARKSKVQPSQVDRRKKGPKKAFGERYKPGAVLYAIRRACERLGIESWHPHQLRHSFGTEARRVAGLEGAQTALGHASATISEIYAERDLGLAVRVAREIG